MIIGITGTLGAGKGTIVEFLKERDFEHLSVRNFLNEELKRRNLELNRDNQVFLANQLRKENYPSYIIEKLFEKAISKDKNCVIESIRTPEEAEKIKKKGGILIAVDADPEIRYSRILSRQSEKDNVTFDKFLEDENREMFSINPYEQNLSECIRISNYKVNNNKDKDYLKKQIDVLLENILNKNKNKKREDYISWDEYFMGVAMISAMRSKDPNSQIGACIVDENNHIIATGYNGLPIGCSDENFPWKREGKRLETKYPYIVHAEANAITNATKDLKDCRIYVPLFPCNECAKLIIQSGIKEVIYIVDKYNNLDEYIASRKMLNASGIKLREFVPKERKLIVDFDKIRN
jgi:dCMP deaminase